MANVQVWNSALTEAEVQYSYTHPEKFAYNTSGSSLTASNLVAWYPMIEGEDSTIRIPLRSPQMYIHDGSVRELGSNLLTDDGWDIDTGWTHVGGGVFNVATGHDANDISQDDAIIGKTHKLTFTISNWTGATDGSEMIRARLGDSPQFTDHYGNGDKVQYGIPSTVTLSFARYLGSGSSTCTISNIELKEVKMGNHGATVFYGEEEMSNGGFETDTGTPPNGWQNLDDHTGVGTADGTAPAGSNVVEVTAGSAGAAADSFRQVEADGLVAGRTYRCTFYAKTISGNTTLSAWVQNSGGDITTNQTITSSWTQYNYTFTANQTTRDQRWWLGGAGVFRMDEVSFKEVGISSGWASVDSEPLIPQTALMGLSKKRAFDGVNDHVVIADNNAFSFTDGSTDEHLSVSAWILPYTAASFPIITKGVTNTSGEWVFQLDASSKLLFQCMDQATSDCWIGKKYNTALTAGKLYHVVATYSGTEASSGIKLYINGEEVTVVTEANDEGSYNYMVNGSADVHIGRYNSGTTNTYAHGIIDEVAIWDTAVLSLAEIQAIFNDGVPLDVSSNSGDYTSSGDLVGYWRNNNFTTAGTWDDLSDTNVNGTMTEFVATDYALLPQGTTAGKDILGFPLTHVNNGWLNLNGAGYVNLSSTDVLSFAGDKPFSVEAWVKMDVAINFAIISKGTYNSGGSGSGEWSLRLENDSKLYFYIYDENGDDSEFIKTDAALSINTWYHIVGTYDGRGGTSANAGMNLFLNGVHIASTGDDTGAYTAMDSGLTGNITIGRTIHASSNDYAYGLIDEVKVYDRVLTSTENNDPTDATEEGDTLTGGDIYKNYKHGLSKHS